MYKSCNTCVLLYSETKRKKKFFLTTKKKNKNRSREKSCLDKINNIIKWKFYYYLTLVIFFLFLYYAITREMEKMEICKELLSCSIISFSSFYFPKISLFNGKISKLVQMYTLENMRKRYHKINCVFLIRHDLNH